MFEKIRKNKFLKNLAGYSLVSLVSFGIGFIATPIMTRVYAPETIGTISMFQSALALLGVIVFAGQDQAVARFYFEKEKKKELISVNIRICIVTWFCTMAAVLMFSTAISKILLGQVNTYAIVMCALCTLPYTAVRLSSMLYRVRNEVRDYSMLNIMLNIITKVGVIGIAFVKADANHWITAFVALYFVIAIYSIIRLVRKTGFTLTFKAEPGLTSELLKFGLPLLVSSFSYLLISYLPKTILSSTAGLYEVGIYASAISLASAINLVENGFNSYFAVYFYENYKNDIGGISMIHHMLTLCSMVLMICMTLFAPIIIHFLGDKYTAALNVFPFIVCANIFNSVSETTVHGIDVAKKTYLHVLISLISSAAGGIGTYFLAKRFHAVGAAMGFSVAMLAFFLLRTFLGQKEIRNIHDLWLTAMSFAVMFGSAILNCIFPGSILMRILIFILCLAMSMVYLLYFMKHKRLLKEIMKS